MKRIQALDGPTPGLVDYRKGGSDQANWDGFCSHQSGAAKRELTEALCSIQHGLCRYCEIDIIECDRQIEHVIPQSDPEQGKARALDPTNMMICCKGGTRQTNDDARWLQPPRRRINRNWNISCGEAKGDFRDPQFIDPRDLPALPSLVRVDYEGEISADEDACIDTEIDVSRVEQTIQILGLNVPRLQIARKRHWDALNDNWKEYLDNPQVMQQVARMELLPKADGHLPRFFSTSRSYFESVAEEILAEAPQGWI